MTTGAFLQLCFSLWKAVLACGLQEKWDLDGFGTCNGAAMELNNLIQNCKCQEELDLLLIGRGQPVINVIEEKTEEIKGWGYLLLMVIWLRPL